MEAFDGLKKFNYHGNRGTKIMGWGDVRYCFAMAILVLILMVYHTLTYNILFFRMDENLIQPYQTVITVENTRTKYLVLFSYGFWTG